MGRTIHSTCNECGTEITLDFGDMTKQQALRAIDKMDNQTRECPGWHVEIGGWKKMWNLEKAVEEAYSEEDR